MPKKNSRPKNKLVRTQNFEMRMHTRKKAKLKWLADQYAGGSMSKWVDYAIEAAPRKMLK